MKNWMKNQNKKRILEKGKINNPNTFSWLDTGTSIKMVGFMGPIPLLMKWCIVQVFSTHE
jgi:hypothetical protein